MGNNYKHEIKKKFYDLLQVNKFESLDGIYKFLENYKL